MATVSTVSTPNHTMSMATVMASTSHSTQRVVASMRTWAILLATIRFTAIGGVNWPMATVSTVSTPNHTTSHW